MKKTKLALVLALGLVSLGLTSPALAKSNKQPFNSNYGSDVYKLGYEDKLLEDNKSSDSSKKSSESRSYGPDVPDDIKKKNESEKKEKASGGDSSATKTDDKSGDKKQPIVGPDPERDKATPSKLNEDKPTVVQSATDSDDNKSETEEKHDTNIAITYEDMGKKKLSSFGSKVYFPKKFLNMDAQTNYLINTVISIPFWITKQIFWLSSMVYEFIQAGNNTNLDSYLTTIVTTSANVFSNLLTTGLLSLAGLIMVMYAYSRHVQGGNFFTSLGRSVFVYLAILLFYSNINGAYVVQKVYNNTNSLTNELTASMVGSTQSYQSSDGVLDLYFRQAIWKPYVYMNTDVKEMKTDGTFTSNDSKVTTDTLKELLDYKSGDDKFKFNDKKTIDKFVGDEKKPKVPRMQNAWGDKFLYGFISMFDAVGMGIIIILMAIISFILKMVFFLLLILSPFIFLLAIFPPFENMFYRFVKSAIVVEVSASAVNFLTVFILYFYMILTNVTEKMFPNYFASTTMKIVVLIVAYWKRDWLVSHFQFNGAESFMRGLGYNFGNVGMRRLNRSFRRMNQGSSGRFRNFGRKNMSRLSMMRQMATGSVKHGASSMINRGVQGVDNTYLKAKGKFLSYKNGWSDETGQEVAQYRRKVGMQRISDTKDKIRGTRDRALANVYGYAGAGMKKGQARDEVLSRANKYRNRVVQKPKLNTQKPKIPNQKPKVPNQKIHNQQTKERLLKQRKERQDVKKSKSGFKRYNVNEKNVKEQLKRNRR